MIDRLVVVHLLKHHSIFFQSTKDNTQCFREDFVLKIMDFNKKESLDLCQTTLFVMFYDVLQKISMILWLSTPIVRKPVVYALELFWVGVSCARLKSGFT